MHQDDPQILLDVELLPTTRHPVPDLVGCLDDVREPLWITPHTVTASASTEYE